ncbi:acyl-CoA thioesterase [Rhodospirillum rubrum]|uniref:Thioesterase superfamily n=1 Tax=Rhodospirillum rubrum (strain ATCC 11170 / ATH 1.1.1 / DSM 467 / LMG 4362 / NCIMB 8255 / S1) TaxID=269796 RepID=Q2RTM6_RHORT|nr:acyl-CoA thioesterase [Rhodospirillum rubrum]ABC22519.1 Thioesterase superfamily [Rhodospirillum rubrum ATCC 11170]AEO48236.1 thioesterase superfamily protein [Rhodospirillum rubrum F11]MBK5954107.1 acyl-CoA thioesterase [Rhodospirillum rubrum]QXG82147.1 acyl-CoA thioesterase [Rhodospirillum rubrum]HAQ00426.1 acyl-CoA thioesterase [Rhodospirillum rubrum]
MTDRSAGTAAATRLVDIVFPEHTNHHGTLFGGIGLAHMDKVAFIAASRHAHVEFVTASCEQVDFAAPTHLGEIVELVGSVTRVGRRSLGVEVELIAEVPLSGERRHCGRGLFTLVALGEGLEARGGALPPLRPGAEAAVPPPPTDDALRMVEMVFPEHTSHYGSLYGGNALAAMGKAAFIAATRHCRKTIVMASSRRVDFKSQIHKGEIVELIPRVTGVGRTSLTVEVELWAEDLLSGDRRLCGLGHFIMVAVDALHRPTVAA